MHNQSDKLRGNPSARERLVGSYKDRSLNPARLELAEDVAISPVLDIGCGDGGYVDALAPEHTTIGLDVLEADDRSWFVRGDASTLPFKDNSFATVLLFEVLEHLPNPDACLQEIQRVTTDQLLMSVPNAVDPEMFEAAGVTMHPFVDPTHVNFYTEATIRKTLETNGFKVESLEYINPIEPGILFLHMLGVPDPLARKLGRRLRWWVPWTRDYYMTILVQALV